MMHITLDDGVTYRIMKFTQQSGTATALIVVPGIAYPTAYQWANCTVDIGGAVFTGVKAYIGRVNIYDPCEEDMSADTEYTLTIVMPKGESNGKTNPAV